MRTPEEHISDLEREGFKLDPEFRGLFLITIKVAQNEVWNEAIELAAENAELEHSYYGENILGVDKQSILKLKL